MDPLAPALANALQQAIRSRLDAFVASDEFQQLWVEANRRAHARVVGLTTGESGSLRLEGDTVYLDFGPAIDRVRTALEQRGLERLAARDPASVDGRVTLLQSEGFVKARSAIDLIQTLAIVLPILALLCLAGHVALSRPRRRGLLRVGLGLVVTALLMLAVIGIGRTLYLDAINPDVLPRQAAADIFDALIALLRTGVRVVAIAADRDRADRSRARPHRGPGAAHEHSGARARDRPARGLGGAAPWRVDGRALVAGRFRMTEHQSEQRRHDRHDRNHADAGAEEADERVEDGARRVARGRTSWLIASRYAVRATPMMPPAAVRSRSGRGRRAAARAGAGATSTRARPGTAARGSVGRWRAS